MITFIVDDDIGITVANNTVGEKKLRQYAEYYEQKAKEYRNKYDIAVNNRLQKELLL